MNYFDGFWITSPYIGWAAGTGTSSQLTQKKAGGEDSHCLTNEQYWAQTAHADDGTGANFYEAGYRILKGSPDHAIWFEEWVINGSPTVFTSSPTCPFAVDGTTTSTWKVYAIEVGGLYWGGKVQCANGTVHDFDSVNIGLQYLGPFGEHVKFGLTSDPTGYSGSLAWRNPSGTWGNWGNTTCWPSIHPMNNGYITQNPNGYSFLTASGTQNCVG